MFARRTGWALTENRYAAGLKHARAEGRKLIDLTASNPTHLNFSFDSHAILSALSQTQSLNYDPDPQGLPSARKAVAEYYNSSRVRRQVLARDDTRLKRAKRFASLTRRHRH